MLLVRDFASADTKSRPALSGVYVQADRAAATDSYTLAEVRAKAPDDAAKVEAFPIMPNGLKARQAPDPFIMPAHVADTIAKSIPKPRKGGTLPILDNAAYAGTDDAGTITIVTTDLETVTPVSFRPIEGPYPAYAPIIPAKKSATTIRINAEYLMRAAKMLQAFNKMEGQYLNALEINYYGPNDALTLNAYGKEHDATVLIMPIRA